MEKEEIILNDPSIGILIERQYGERCCGWKKFGALCGGI